MKFIITRLITLRQLRCPQCLWRTFRAIVVSLVVVKLSTTNTRESQDPIVVKLPGVRSTCTRAKPKHHRDGFSTVLGLETCSVVRGIVSLWQGV